MQVITSVTQKGQITLPKKFRDKLGIKTNSKVCVEIQKDSVKVTPTYDILDLAGTFKSKAGKSVLKSREEFEKSFRP